MITMMMMYNVEGQKKSKEIIFKHQIPQSLLRVKLKCPNRDSSLFIGASQEFFRASFQNDPSSVNAMLILNKKIFFNSCAESAEL